MKIKKIPLLICIVALMTVFSLGLSAAPIQHDIAADNVILTDSCGENCPGHVITGTSHFENTIQILSGDHQVTLKDLDIHCSYPDVPFTLEAGAKADATIEGEVRFNGKYGILSHGELHIFGDETSLIYFTGLYEGMYVTDDLTVKGGNINIGTASYPGEAANPEKFHLYALFAQGGDVTVTFEDADVWVFNNDYYESQPYFKEDVEYGGIASGGIIAPNLVLKNTVLKVDPGDVCYEDGLTPKSIGIDVKELKVSGSEIQVNAGDCYDSFGIRCTGTANFVESEVTVNGGAAKNKSIGLDAIDAMAVGVFENSFLELIGGESDYISVGGHVNIMDVVNSTVYAYGGEANRYSAGLAGGLLSADGSDVKGYGGVATDDNVVDDEGVFSEGIFIETINGTDSEIYGEGEKAMISTGISATEISINGGVICGNASDESDDSIGIYLSPSEMDDGIAIPVKFEIVNGNVVARGGTQGVLADTEDFSGISYKADKNSEAQVKTDLDGKEVFFGNKYKVSYVGGDVVAENLPAGGTYYLDEVFLLSKEVPTAEDYLFMGWRDAYGTFFKAEDDNYVSMDGEDMVYTAVWKCLGGNNCILNEFDDLNAKAWYHDGIEFSLVNKYMQGMSKTAFEPDTAATRAMIVTTLYRTDGEPFVETQNEFPDVPADTWYTDAVNWAVECGIVTGYEDGTFRPDRLVTREELAVLLYRMADYYGADLMAEDLPEQFTDKGEVSNWAVSAMAWAVDQNIINGVSKDTLAPQDKATRAQLATMLYRFHLSLLGEA